jgi:hypothetical protein
MTSFEKVEYKGWPNCYRLSNSVIELIVTGDVGPRLIRFGFVGEDNEFAEFPQVGETGGSEWKIYGGHRLWHAPEVQPRTYYPDNMPITVKDKGKFVQVIQPVEPTTGIQKEINLTMDAAAARVRVVHRLRNTNLWPVELAPWALTVLAPGGKAIIPQPPRGSHTENLLPANTLTLWAYTDMADPRWTWGTRYIMLRQDPKATVPQKLGAKIPAGWTAYARNGHLFLKTFKYVAGAAYPDYGCSVETFTNTDMLELETLGPLVKIEPRGAVDYTENWFLFKGVPVPANDADVDVSILPKAQEALAGA